MVDKQHYSIFTFMIVDTRKLKTVKNYAKKKGVNRSWIYQQIGSNAIEPVRIDGVLFVKDDDVQKKTKA